MRKTKTYLYRKETDNNICSFFGLLTGTLHLENRISRVFHACFEHSISFRLSFLNLLKEHKVIKQFLPDDLNDWKCIYQPQTPNTARLKPDLLIYRLSCPESSAVYIESKIHARLTETQLKNYKHKGGVNTLVAITKYLPDIPIKAIKKLNVHTLRWQDIHASLAHRKFKTQHDRFICRHFIHFLEEAEMAYNQDLKLADFNDISSLLRTFAKSSIDGIGKFDYRLDCLSRCSSLLSEIAIELGNHYPKLNDMKKWSGYYNTSDDNGDIEYHVLQYSIYKSSYDKNRYYWGFWFPQDSQSSIEWSVFYVKNGIQVNEKECYLEEIVRKGRIDTTYFAKSVISQAKKWKVSLK